MRRFSFTSFIAVSSLALGVTQNASADSTPVVRGIPNVPTFDARLAASKKRLQVALDSAPPASTQFYFEVPETNAAGSSGTLHVWPRAEQADDSHCADSAPERARQSYTLGMSATKDGDQSVLRATVPPLQVGQTFCFSVDVQLTFAAADMADISSIAGATVFAQLQDSAGGTASHCDTPDLYSALVAALKAAGLTADNVKQAAALALIGYKTTLQGGNTAHDDCVAAQKAAVTLAAVQAKIPSLQQTLDVARQAIKALPPLPPLQAPRLYSGGAETDAAALSGSGATAATLTDAAAQLKVRSTNAAYSAADQAVLVEWSGALSAMADAAAASGKPKAEADQASKTAKTKLEAAKKRHLASGEVELITPGSYAPSERLTTGGNPDNVPTASVAKDLSTFISTELKPPQPTLDRWTSAFNTAQRVETSLASAVADVVNDTTLVNATAQALQGALPPVFAADNVREALIVSADSLRVSGQAGQGTTPAAANYASVDAGAVLAFPVGGISSQPWILPYLGLNIYTAPVDRVVSPSDLTGGFWMDVRQRLSATIGFTLSDPTIPGRTLSPMFLGHYPVVALGFRTTQFTRVTAGTVLYNVADANPASAQVQLGGAVFLGAALDIDVIQLLTQAKL